MEGGQSSTDPTASPTHSPGSLQPQPHRGGHSHPNSVQYFCIKLRPKKKKQKTNQQKTPYLVAIISAVEMKGGGKTKKNKKGNEAAEFTILTATGRSGKYRAALSPPLARQRRGLKARITSHSPRGFAVYRGTGSCREPGPALLTGQAASVAFFGSLWDEAGVRQEGVGGSCNEEFWSWVFPWAGTQVVVPGQR